MFSNMGHKNKGFGYFSSSSSCIVVIVIVSLLANSGGVHAQSTYACWGGCYNTCFITAKATDEAQSFACHYKCLNTCIPHSAADFNYYCQIGCSLKLCIPVSYDGAKLERCFGKCTNLCKETLKP